MWVLGKEAVEGAWFLKLCGDKRNFSLRSSAVCLLLQGGHCWNRLVGAPGINEAAWCCAEIDASRINCAVFKLRLFILSYVVTGRDVSLQHSPRSPGKESFSLRLPSLPAVGRGCPALARVGNPKTTKK